MNERERQAMMKLFLNNEIDNVRPVWNKHGYARRTNVVWTTASTVPSKRGLSEVHNKYHGKTDYYHLFFAKNGGCEICLMLIM